jgi:hypothetical protein
LTQFHRGKGGITPSSISQTNCHPERAERVEGSAVVLHAMSNCPELRLLHRFGLWSSEEIAKPPREDGFVSGHDFSRAAKRSKN